MIIMNEREKKTYAHTYIYTKSEQQQKKNKPMEIIQYLWLYLTPYRRRSSTLILHRHFNDRILNDISFELCL